MLAGARPRRGAAQRARGAMVAARAALRRAHSFSYTRLLHVGHMLVLLRLLLHGTEGSPCRGHCMAGEWYAIHSTTHTKRWRHMPRAHSDAPPMLGSRPFQHMRMHKCVAAGATCDACRRHAWRHA